MIGLGTVPEMINDVVERAQCDPFAVREVRQVAVSGANWIVPVMNGDWSSNELAVGLKCELVVKIRLNKMKQFIYMYWPKEYTEYLIL